MRAERVVLGDVHEAPMPQVGVDDLRQALGLCDCRGVARSGEPAVKVSVRALHAMEKASHAVSPLSCAGALLGTVYQVGESWLIDVQEVLTFSATPEMHRVRVPRHAWQEMLATRKARFPEMRVVGWFHSHPGLGANFSDADAFVQRFFFPADWQVASVLDPDRREIQFYHRRGRNMAPLGAWWVERGKAPSSHHEVPTSPSPDMDRPAQKVGKAPLPQQPEVLDAQQTSETYLKERFVERSLEKILRLLKEPPLSLRDFAMMGMMGLLLIVLIFTRLSASSSNKELAEIAQKLDKISQRLDALPSAAAAPAAVAAKPSKPSSPASAHTPTETASSAAAPKTTATTADGPSEQKAPADGQPDVEHVLQPGESLWTVADQYYGDGSLMNALLRYNKIADARDLRAGTAVKVPSVKKLAEMTPPPAKSAASAHNGAADKGAAPPPTPH